MASRAACRFTTASPRVRRRSVCRRCVLLLGPLLGHRGQGARGARVRHAAPDDGASRARGRALRYRHWHSEPRDRLRARAAWRGPSLQQTLRLLLFSYQDCPLPFPFWVKPEYPPLPGHTRPRRPDGARQQASGMRAVPRPSQRKALPSCHAARVCAVMCTRSINNSSSITTKSSPITANIVHPCLLTYQGTWRRNLHAEKRPPCVLLSLKHSFPGGKKYDSKNNTAGGLRSQSTSYA